MPTYFTEQIINGKVTTLKEFVLLSLRCFGAGQHQAEDEIGTQFKPKEPSLYYQNEIDRITLKIDTINSMTDQELIQSELDSINDSISYYRSHLKRQLENNAKLTKLLQEVTDWTIPSEEYRNIKEFMINQIYSTINGDLDEEFYENELHKYERKLDDMSSFDCNKKRTLMLLELEEDLARAITKRDEEVIRINKVNQWVETLFKSIDNESSSNHH